MTNSRQVQIKKTRDISKLASAEVPALSFLSHPCFTMRAHHGYITGMMEKNSYRVKHNDIRWRIWYTFISPTTTINQQVHAGASKERTPNCATKHQSKASAHPDVSLTQTQTSGTWLNILNMNSSFDLSHETLNPRHNKKGREHNPLALLITKPYELWLNCSQRQISRQIRCRRAPVHLTVMCYVTIKAWACFSCWKVKYVQLDLPVSACLCVTYRSPVFRTSSFNNE